MEDKDIEILDLDDDINDDVVVNNRRIKNNNKKGSNKSKKRRLKKGLFQTIFCFVSLLFIIGCCIFYGNRLIKYYKIYNPKMEGGASAELISTTLTQNTEIVSEGAGLYRENGLYVFKGEEANNYIKYANMLWRIIRTNADGSVEIITDDYINILAWDFNGKDYVESDINKYLNDVFLKQLDTSYLIKTSICTDAMESVGKFVCDNKNTDYYVTLLQANDYLNSVVDGTTYVSRDEDMVWLSSYENDKKAWVSDGSNISTSEITNTYFVKPVVTLKNAVALLGGSGSKEDPYVIEKNDGDIKFGSYLTIDEDTWVVIDKDEETIKLAYAGLYNKGLSTYRFDTSLLDYKIDSKNSLAELLNTKFYEGLSYKDLLLDFDLYTATYTKGYKNTYKEKVTVKVGIPSVTDLKFDNDADGYYVSNKSPREGRIYYYDTDLISSKPGISRPYKPVISIEIPKIAEGEGTKEKPYKVEV